MLLSIVYHRMYVFFILLTFDMFSKRSLPFNISFACRLPTSFFIWISIILYFGSLILLPGRWLVLSWAISAPLKINRALVCGMFPSPFVAHKVTCIAPFLHGFIFVTFVALQWSVMRPTTISTNFCHEKFSRDCNIFWAVSSDECLRISWGNPQGSSHACN